MDLFDELLANNQRWVAEKLGEDPRFFERLSKIQSPELLWIGCSDSRVPANVVCGLDPGEVSVHRNVANVIHSSDLNMLSSLEYAVETLEVQHIIICGHYGCGGVHASTENCLD